MQSVVIRFKGVRHEIVYLEMEPAEAERLKTDWLRQEVLALPALP